MMNDIDDVEIVDFHLSESASVGELFHTCWREDHIFFRCPEMLRWYCFDNPYARLFSRGLTVKGAYDNKKLVGFFAYFPFLLNRYGKRAYGLHTAQWYTYPEHRGKSLGLKLLNSAWDFNRIDICFALGNNDAARAIFKKWKWPFIELWPRYLLVLDKEQCRRLLADDSESLAHLKSLSTPRLPRQRECRTDIEEPKTIKGLPWDNFYWNEFATTSVGPAREEQYLVWRYEDIPLFKYRYLTASVNGLLQGLLIYRIEKVRDRQEKVVRIVELMSTLPCSGPLLDRLVDLSLTENAAFVDFFCTSRLYASTLFERGFIQDDSSNHYVLPFLFQPLDITRLTLDIAWKVSDTALVPDQGWEGLYLTKGDGFHDVPN